VDGVKLEALLFRSCSPPSSGICNKKGEVMPSKYGAKSKWDRYKGELVAYNFRNQEIDRIVFLFPMGFEHKSEVSGFHYGYWGKGTSIFSRNLGDNETENVIQYVKSGLAFKAEYFVQKFEDYEKGNDKWKVFKVIEIDDFKLYVDGMEEIKKRREDSRESKRKENLTAIIGFVVVLLLSLLASWLGETLF
jgi:hypothetical protein